MPTLLFFVGRALPATQFRQPRYFDCSVAVLRTLSCASCKKMRIGQLVWPKITVAASLITARSVRCCLFRGKGLFYAPHGFGRGRDRGSFGGNRLPDVQQSVRLLRPGLPGAWMSVVRVAVSGRFYSRRRPAAIACRRRRAADVFDDRRHAAADIICPRSTPGAEPNAVR